MNENTYKYNEAQEVFMDKWEVFVYLFGLELCDICHDLKLGLLSKENLLTYFALMSLSKHLSREDFECFMKSSKI